LAIFVSAPTLMSFSVARSMRSIFSGGAAPLSFLSLLSGGAAPLPLTGAGWACCCWGGPVHQAVYQFPQFVQSFARDRRDRQHGICKHGFELTRRADPFTAREFVDFRGHHGRVSDCPLQPGPRLPVAVETRMPRVDQEQRRNVRRQHGRGEILESHRAALAKP